MLVPALKSAMFLDSRQIGTIAKDNAADCITIKVIAVGNSAVSKAMGYIRKPPWLAR